MRKGKKTRRMFAIIVSLLTIAQIIIASCIAAYDSSNALSDSNTDLEKTISSTSDKIIDDSNKYSTSNTNEYNTFQDLLKRFSISSSDSDASLDLDSCLSASNNNLNEIDDSSSGSIPSISSTSISGNTDISTNEELINRKEELIAEKEIIETKTEYYSSKAAAEPIRNRLSIEYTKEKDNSYTFKVTDQNGLSVSDVSVYVAGNVKKTDSDGEVNAKLIEAGNRYIVKCFAENYKGSAITIKNTVSENTLNDENTDSANKNTENPIIKSILDNINKLL